MCFVENSVLFGILWLEICVFSAENSVLFGILWLENMCVLLKTPFCLELCGWKCVFSAEISVLFGILWLEMCVFS